MRLGTCRVRAWAGGCAALALGLHTGVAHAQPASSSPAPSRPAPSTAAGADGDRAAERDATGASEPSSDEVDAWFEQANARFAARDYAAALALLERACAQTHFPGCALNLGAVHHALRHCAKARSHYAAYLQLDPDGERAEEARAALAELDAHCRGEREGATAAPSSAPERPRRVEGLVAPGAGLAVREWPSGSATPASGDPAPATTHPAGSSASSDAALGSSDRASRSTPRARDEPPRYRAVAASVMVLGGVAGLTSLFLGVRLADANEEFRRHKGEAFDEAQAARLERAREYRALTVGSGIASGALLGVGGLFWWLGADADASANVAIGLDSGASVRVSGRF